MKKIQVRTANRELYKKFNLLNFLDEIIVVNVNYSNLSRMINRINKKNKILDIKKVDNYFIIKKRGPYTFDVSFKY